MCFTMKTNTRLLSVSLFWLSLTVITTLWVFCNHSSTLLCNFNTITYTPHSTSQGERKKGNACVCMYSSLFCVDYSCKKPRSHSPLSWSMTLQYYSLFGCLPNRNIVYTVKHHPLVRGENNSLGCHSPDKDNTSFPLWRPAMPLINRWLVCFLMGLMCMFLLQQHLIQRHTHRHTQTLCTRHAMPRQSGHFCFCSPLLLVF